MSSNSEHKSGFVNIIGNPNVGKSSLLNAFIGVKLAAITPKAQTTRHRIFGIYNSEELQIVFSDTPGVIDPAYKMQESMMASVKEALSDADIFLIVVEIGDHRFKDERILEKVKSSNVPIILAINKIDSSNQNQLEMDVAFWKDYFEDKAEILPISVIENFNISTLLNRISELIPIAPPWFPKDQISDRNDRFIVSEVIRENILELYDQEIPYSVQIEVETFKEEAKLISIRAVIIVSRDSQKSIIIGKGGAMIKRLGSVSRKSLETYFSKKVYLETFVKTDKNWRNDERKLKKYGY